MSLSLTIRKPCFFHSNCDETAVGLLHRSAKEGDPREDEKFCNVCEGIFPKIRETLEKTGKWNCPVCGFEHKLVIVNGKKDMSPKLSCWYDGLVVNEKS